MFTDPELAWPGETEQMLQLTAELNLTHRITHYYSIPHRRMPDYLSRVADSGGALLITSMTESFAYAAPEAICCRCPVVTTDCDGVRAVITHEVTGLYYPHGDIAGGARQVLRLLTQPALRERLVTSGQRRIRKELSPQRFAGLFVQMLQSLGAGPC
jgi:glycosyltransferase involved in cell wall biosynthesis